MTTLARKRIEPELFDEAEVEIVRFMNIETAADLWLGEKQRDGLAAGTLREYRRTLYGLNDALPGVDISEVTTTMIRRYLDSIATSSRKWEIGKPKSPMMRKNEIVAVDTFFDWIAGEGIIRNNPTRRNGIRILARPKVGKPEDNPNVVRVSSVDVRKLFEAAEGFQEKLTIAALAYLGPRRHALAMARITDYSAETGRLRFREKGSKTIEKPCPAPLVNLIEAARAAGVYDNQPYLIPNGRRRKDESVERSDRVIWEIVKRVAAKADVDAHVHALRAAFAVKFLEDRVGDQYDLQLLLGHSSPETTRPYVRYLDKQQRMERVLDMDWGVAVATPDTPGKAEIAGKTFVASSPQSHYSSQMGERGFEPLSSVDADGQTAHSTLSAPGSRATPDSDTVSPDSEGSV